MTNSALIVAPVEQEAVVAVVQPALNDLGDTQHGTVHLAALTREQVGQTDQVFAQQQEESNLVAGMFGLWTSVLLGHELMVEHFEGRDDEEARRFQPVKKEE
jgi:hypothetical protein